MASNENMQGHLVGRSDGRVVYSELNDKQSVSDVQCGEDDPTGTGAGPDVQRTSYVVRADIVSPEAPRLERALSVCLPNARYSLTHTHSD